MGDSKSSNSFCSVDHFVNRFDDINPREICIGCVHETEPFDSGLCLTCRILKPSNYKSNKKRVRSIK